MTAHEESACLKSPGGQLAGGLVYPDGSRPPPPFLISLTSHLMLVNRPGDLNFQLERFELYPAAWPVANFTAGGWTEHGYKNHRRRCRSSTRAKGKMGPSLSLFEAIWPRGPRLCHAPGGDGILYRR